MSQLPYPIVSPEHPILIVYVRGVDLDSIVSVGETALYIKRVGDLLEFAKYLPFEKRGNQLSFAFDSVLFTRLGGRYLGRLIYNGAEIQTMQFVYKPTQITMEGRTDV